MRNLITLRDFTLTRRELEALERMPSLNAWAAGTLISARKDMRHAAVVLGLDTGKVHGPVSPAEIREMRGWLADCEWADMDVGSIAELTDTVVLRGVARHYEGGIAEFRRNVEGCV